MKRIIAPYSKTGRVRSAAPYWSYQVSLDRASILNM